MRSKRFWSSVRVQPVLCSTLFDDKLFVYWMQPRGIPA